MSTACTKTRQKKFTKQIWKYTNPKIAQKKAYKYLGKTAKLYPSRRHQKKYEICDPILKKWVHFGQLGYEDYTKHKNKSRRNNYLKRTSKIRGNWKQNKYSPNNLSRNILW